MSETPSLSAYTVLPDPLKIDSGNISYGIILTDYFKSFMWNLYLTRPACSLANDLNEVG